MVCVIRKQQTRGLAGFALSELMIIVVLITVIASITGPSLLNVIRIQRLRAAAVAMASQVSAARAAAQRSNSVCVLAASGTVLRCSTGCGSASLPAVNLSSDAQTDDLTLNGDTTFSFTSGGLLAGSTAQQIAYLAISGFTPRVCVSVERPSALVRIGVANDGGTTCTYTG